jgi:DNA invertase Pin-like site-specific DNA recombinase
MLGIYCRISKNREGQKSIKEQRLQGEEFAKRNGLDFNVYIDEGISGGGDTEKRIAFTKLMNDIETNIIKSVFLINQDRLEREEVTWFKFANLIIDKDIKLYEDGILIDLNDIGVWFSRGVMSQANALYRKGLSKKIKQVLHRNLSEGKVHSIPNYGYKKGIDNLLIIDEEQSEIIKRIYELSLNGIGINKIAEILNKDGIKTKYNILNKGTLSITNKYTKTVTTINKSDIKWKGNTIRNILTNTTYKGIRKFGGFEYKCPGIFDEIYWQKVNDNLQSNRNNGGKVATYNYLLKGLLRCGKCGRNYYGKTRANNKDHFYMCSSKRIKEDNCGNRSININALELLIWSKFVSDGKLLELINIHYEKLKNTLIVSDLENEIKANIKELKSAEDDKSYFLELVLSKEIQREDISGKMIEINTKINTSKIKIENLKNQLDSIIKSSNEDNSELINIPSLSFIDKVEILKKYIYDIKIYYYGSNYYLEVFFNIVNMESVVFFIDDKYKYAYTLSKNEDYINDKENRVYIIKGNLEKDKNTQEFQVNLLTLYTRFIQFNILKQSYKINSIKQSI